ncbi:hypothetical protein Poly30_26690 [Planctomycetes bacterium Poly30]|uniref:Uncharacterized protein n=1 Tax=Saltatorellus ferox TaxID=2528018 RepID=A0A518ESS8_9BACT|nr:hypothetical protein Poly30_26690 [Planctomycetes bacterium Poly30]
MKSVLLLLSFALFACGPKTEAVDPAPAETAAAGPRWVAPEGWTEQEVQQPMRFKQFELAGATEEQNALCVIAHWPQGIGGIEVNLDRWVGQVSAPGSTLKARDLTADQRWVSEPDGYLVTSVHVEGTIQPMPGMGSDIATHESGAILAGFIEVENSPEVWTVKITGPSKTIADHKDRYLQFISGI